MTIGQAVCPPCRYRSVAALFTIWSKAQEMKSMNCISQIGRIPWTASPTPAPTISDSAIGMSTTRSGPNFSWSPAEVLNAPPSTPTSSPMSMTFGSRAISSSMAWRIASM